MNTYRIDRQAEAVREVQRYLLELSYVYSDIPHVESDGIYGVETEEGVRAFQRLFSLPVTGEADEETFALLFREFSSARDERIGESTLIPREVFPLRMGDSGSYVRILQSALDEILGTPIPSDGFFGRKTEDAVRLLESKLNQTPSGEVTREAWQIIAKEYREALRRKNLL